MAKETTKYETQEEEESRKKDVERGRDGGKEVSEPRDNSGGLTRES